MENSDSGFKIPIPQEIKQPHIQDQNQVQTIEDEKDTSNSGTILSERQRHVLVGLIGLCIVCLVSYLLLALLNILKE